jgi:hypothetical protein
MLKNCLFGTYRAPATKILFVSATSADPATTELVGFGWGSPKLLILRATLQQDHCHRQLPVCPSTVNRDREPVIGPIIRTRQ